MPQHLVNLELSSEEVLAEVVSIHNKKYNTRLTKKQFLSWILNRWFEQKVEDKYGVEKKCCQGCGKNCSCSSQKQV